MTRAAVVGAGLGGLSAAVHLALAGFEVEVFDQAADPGGKAAERRLGPFRFDTGPSLVTMAEVWDELFAAAGKRREDALRFTRLDPVARYFWPGGERLAAPGSPEGLARAFAEQGWASEEATLGWFSRGRALWDLVGDAFLRHSLHDRRFWLSPATWATLLRAGRLDSARNLGQAIEASFDHPHVRQFFGRYATYNGSDPRRTPATFALVPWVEFGRGAWSADDGIHAIPRAMHRLAADLGVRFRFSSPVASVVHSRGRVQGLTLAGPGRSHPLHPFDLVVSNADVGPTYRLLEAGGPLDPPRQKWRDRYRRGEPSTSGVVFLWGMDADHPEMGLHNVFFSPDSGAEFQALFAGRVPDDPTVYVNISSKVTPGDAPPGQENWFVLVNAPHDPGPDRIVGPETLAALREATLARIEANLGRPVRHHIVQEAILTPADLEAATGSPGGSLYGLASHRARSAFDRHPNRAPGFRGLYLCGGSAHPGGGMPLAVLSGRIAADLATRDFPQVQPRDGTP